MKFLYRHPCGYGSLQGGGCDGAGRKITVDLGRGSSNATQIGHGLPRQYVPRKGAMVPLAFGTACFVGAALLLSKGRCRIGRTIVDPGNETMV